MKKQIKLTCILIAILGIAAVLRYTGIDWDTGQHLHPDERFILMTVDKLNFQKDMNPHFFAYGSFPLYLLKIVGTIAAKVSPQLATYDRIYLLGRILSGLFDIGTILCIFYIARQLTKHIYIALLGALWYALSVLPIQLSHFYAVDTLLTFFSSLTLVLLLRYHTRPRVRYAVGVGIACGLAIATKVSAAVLFVPISITFLVHLKRDWKKTVYHGSLLLFAALYTFFITEPFAFLDFPTFRQQLTDQQTMTKSAFTFPYTLQYVGKIPYVYEFKNIVLWGQGIFLGILSSIGVLYATIQTAKKKNIQYLILLSYFWIYTAIVGRFSIGFMRYMLPVYPLLTIFAVVLIQKCTQLISQKKSICIYGVCTGIILCWTIPFMEIYAVPNTRVTATKWIETNIQEQATIAVEHWDDRLPLEFAYKYNIQDLPLYDADTAEKWKKINQTLNATEYIIIASNRLYTPLMKMTQCEKLPQYKCYKTTSTYYQQLFAGSLGFTQIKTFETYPTIPFTGIHINDQSADESFTVYDHPKIMIFKKTGVFTPIRLEE